MTYQVCVLNTNDMYCVLYSTTVGNDALAFYNARIDEDFATPYSTTNNTFNLVIPCLQLNYSEMTETQQTNITANICADPLTYMMTVCF